MFRCADWTFCRKLDTYSDVIYSVIIIGISKLHGTFKNKYFFISIEINVLEGQFVSWQFRLDKLAEINYISHPPGKEVNTNYWWINIRPFCSEKGLFDCQ